MKADGEVSLDGLHVVLLTASASRLGGGVATAVVGQAQMIRSMGGQATIVALEDAFSEEDRAAIEAPLVTAPVKGPAQIGYAPDLLDLLLRSDADIVHLNGIWMYPSHAGAQWAKRTGRPYLVSPHGMLDPWIVARGRWKKALARLGYERNSWSRAAALHALTRDEGRDIGREAGDRPILTIPNAGPPATSEAVAARDPLVIYLGRIHPKKNLDALIDAWEQAELPPGAELAIAGWGEPGDVSAFEERLASAPKSVSFLGPVHGEQKQRLLQRARFMVLASHSEGLPMAILESWATGAPTIMTDACHLSEGFEAGAAIRCETDAGSIARALGQALALAPAEWQEMSSAALSLARERFSPGAVAREWVAAYRGLVAGVAL